MASDVVAVGGGVEGCQGVFVGQPDPYSLRCLSEVGLPGSDAVEVEGVDGLVEDSLGAVVGCEDQLLDEGAFDPGHVHLGLYVVHLAEEHGLISWKIAVA